MEMTDLYPFFFFHMPSFTVCLINRFGCFCHKHANTLEKGSVQSAWRNAVMLEMQPPRAGKIAMYYKQTFLPSL